MRLLDRYVFMEALAPFAFGMAAFNGILFASDPLRKAIVVFVENHVPVQEAVLLLLYRVPIIMAMTFPMAMLLGTLLGVGRLSSDNEAAAMFAGGASVHRLLVPVWVLGLLISAVAFGLTSDLSHKPWLPRTRCSSASASAQRRSPSRPSSCGTPKRAPWSN